ncbi:MAG: glycosyltransferase family 4 protein [Candidatus Binatia bacterium]
MRSNHDLRITFYDPSGSGGICHYTFQLAENLVRMGCDVTIVTTEGYELNHLRRNFKIKILFKKSRVWAVIAWAIFKMRGTPPTGQLYHQLTNDESPASESISVLRVLRTMRQRITLIKGFFYFLLSHPHLIHFHWLVEPREDYYLIKFLKLFRFKIVYTAHNLLPHDCDTPDEREAFQKIYRLVDKVIVHSRNNKKEMIRLFNLDANKICIVPHGSNDLFYAQRNISKEAAREKLGILPEKKVLLFFGLIRRYKGLEHLVEAFKEVKTSIRNVTLLIVGQIHDADAKVLEYYSRLIAELDKRDDVMSINEYIPFENVGCYFSASDVVVLPYIKTYQSGVLLSAYAAGRPVVVTDTGGLSEVVVDGKSGFVVPPQNTRALAQAIIRIIKNSNKLEEMSRYAKDLAETTYSWRSVALKTVDVYRSLAVEY